MRVMSVRQRNRVNTHIAQHGLHCSTCGGKRFEVVGKVTLPLHAAFTPDQVRGMPPVPSGTEWDLGVVLVVCLKCRTCVFLDLPALST